MNKTQIVKWLLLLAVLLAVIIFWWQSQRPQAVTPSPLSQVKCVPSKGNCIVKFDSGELQWRVEKPIQYLQPFVSTIKLTNVVGSDIQQVSVEYVMQGMQMAVNRSVFKRRSPMLWQAQSILPICASGRKDWLAIVRLKTRGGVWQAGFEFMLTANQN